MIRQHGWYSDIDPDDEVGYPWRPCLQTDSCNLSFEVWFKTEAECDKFIDDHIIGQGRLPEP